MRRVRVALIQRVCSQYRVPLFKRLSIEDEIDLRVYFSRLPGRARSWKLRNDPQAKDLKHREMRGVWFRMKYRDRVFPVVINPSLFLYLIRQRPDVVICEGESNIVNNLLVLVYAKLSKTPYIWWGLGTVRSRRSSWFRRTLKPIIAYMLRNASAILAYSTFAAQFYASYGVKKDKIFVTYNSIDTNKALEDIKKYGPHVAEAKRQLGISGKQIVLFVGTFEKTKRIDDLIEAYKELKSVYADVALILVGDGEERARLEYLVQRERIRDVVFTGQKTEDVSLYFLMADVFVLPGLGGLAINQAMAHGLPVVTVSADGTELDMIEDGKNGFIIPTGNREALRDAIADILHDPSLRDSMGKHSRYLVDTRFNVGHQVQQICCAIKYSIGGDS